MIELGRKDLDRTHLRSAVESVLGFMLPRVMIPFHDLRRQGTGRKEPAFHRMEEGSPEKGQSIIVPYYSYAVQAAMSTRPSVAGECKGMPTHRSNVFGTLPAMGAITSTTSE